MEPDEIAPLTLRLPAPGSVVLPMETPPLGWTLMRSVRVVVVLAVVPNVIYVPLAVADHCSPA